MADSQYIRTFVCFELPSEVKERIGSIQDELRPLGRGVRWVKPAGIHLTLKFLGDVEQSQLSRVADAVKAAANESSAMTINISNIGAFPDMKRPRVYWVGVQEASGALKNCQGAIERGLEPLGFEQEKRAFSPHLTIGRVKSMDGVADISQKLQNMQIETMSFSPSEIVIMQSELKPSGAVYTPLYQYNL